MFVVVCLGFYPGPAPAGFLLSLVDEVYGEDDEKDEEDTTNDAADQFSTKPGICVIENNDRAQTFLSNSSILYSKGRYWAAEMSFNALIFEGPFILLLHAHLLIHETRNLAI